MKTQLTAVIGVFALGVVLAHAAEADSLGQHPAVLVAQKWQTRGIDPNTFIVLHPAGPQFVPASPTSQISATREMARPAAPVAQTSK